MSGLDFIKHVDDVLYAVCGKVLIVEQRACLAAGARPAHADHAALAHGLGGYVFLHDTDELEVDVAHGDNIVYVALLAQEAVFDVARLRGTRRDEHDRDILRLELRVLSQRFFTRDLSRQLDRRHHGDDVIAKIGKAQRDEPHNRGTGGVDHGITDVFFAHVTARIFRDDLRGTGYLEHIVKADVQ